MIYGVFVLISIGILCAYKRVTSSRLPKDTEEVPLRSVGIGSEDKDISITVDKDEVLKSDEDHTFGYKNDPSYKHEEI